MKVFIILTTTLIFMACDSPTRTRFQDVSSQPVNIADEEAQTTDTDGKDIPGGTPTTPVVDDGFADCNLGYQYYGGPQIKSFGICQSTLNETVFKVKLAEQDLSVGTCFVPVHIINGGSSFKLGIAECVHNRADQEYDMTLTKERGEPVNGVMVIKAGPAINAYMSCMSAKVDYIRSIPNCQYSQSCVQQADNWANHVCTQFVGTYSTFYSQVNL